MNEITDWIARILFWSIILPSGSFVVLYAARSKWWVSAIGRILMGLFIAITYMTGLSLARYVLGDFPGEDVFRIVGYLAINLGVWHMVYTLHRIQTDNPISNRMPRHERVKENSK